MSTKPGVTIAPAASIVRFAPSSTLQTATIRSPSMATSPVYGSAPVPSTIVPPVMTMSCDIGVLLHCGEYLVLEQVAGSPGFLAIGVGGRADDDQPVDAEVDQLLQPGDAVVGRADDAEAVDEPGGQLGRLRRTGPGVVVHVVGVVHLVQHGLGLGVDRR